MGELLGVGWKGYVGPPLKLLGSMAPCPLLPLFLRVRPIIYALC